MPLTFLVPLALAGLAALAIPIWIHLTHRDRRDVVRFPSLMFLRRIPFKTVRRQRIRHWLLFLVRSVALIALVLAFARPLWDAAGVGAADLARAREVVVLLDRSFSMGYGDRWDRARQAARDVVAQLGPEERASLVLFSDNAEVAVQSTSDVVALGAAIDRATLGSGSTRYAPAVRMAEQILEDTDLARKEVVLITDFQKIGWDRDDDLRLPAGAVIRRVDLSDSEPENLAVTGVTLERVTDGGRQRVTVAARVANLGARDADDVEVTFEIDGQVLQRQSVTLPAKGGSTVRFTEVAVPPRLTRAAVSAGSDPLPGDNTFRFVLRPVAPLSVLIVQHPNAGSRNSLYLSRALEIGNAPDFEVAVRSTTRFRRADLVGRSVVILNDGPLPRGSGGADLLSFVTDGGGVLVALGRRSPANAWPATARALLPGAVGSPVDRPGDRWGTLSQIDYDHPVFELFSQPRSGDFSEARFARYRPVADTGTAAVLARFDDGAVALAERRIGAGRVLTWASDLGNLWNDLPVQAVFLPFVHRMMTYLADYNESTPWHVAGQVLDLFGDPRLAATVLPGGEPAEGSEIELVVDPPTGDRYMQRITAASPYLQLQEQGFYRVRRLEDDDANASVIAVNLAAVESDLTPIDAEELAVAVTSAGQDAQVAGTVPVLALDERERRQGLWWYLLIILFVALAFETVLSNRLQPAR